MKNITIESILDEPSYHAKKIFDTYPQLKNIWPLPFTETMQEAVTEDLHLAKEYEFDFGNIFVIKKDNNVIGITGFFVDDGSGTRQNYNENTTEIYLRWHGIIYEQRRQGISEYVMQLLLEQAGQRYPQVETLIELVPLTDYGKPLEEHFKKLGFIGVGHPENYDWSEYDWQPYHLNVPHFLSKYQKENNNIDKKKTLK